MTELLSLLVIPATIFGLDTYFKSRGVNQKKRFSKKSHIIIKGVHVHHSAIGLVIAAAGSLVGLIWLAFIGLGIFLHHLIYEDISNKGVVFFERRRGSSIKA